jgi:hypothetical protein
MWVEGSSPSSCPLGYTAPRVPLIRLASPHSSPLFPHQLRLAQPHLVLATAKLYPCP